MSHFLLQCFGYLNCQQDFDKYKFQKLIDINDTSENMILNSKILCILKKKKKNSISLEYQIKANSIRGNAAFKYVFFYPPYQCMNDLLNLLDSD